MEQASTDLKVARLVINKFGEVFDNFQSHAFSVMALSEQWSNLQSSFAVVHVSMVSRVKELTSKERELSHIAQGLENLQREVELRQKRLDSGESSLRERVMAVELREKHVTECCEIMELEKRQISERCIALQSKEKTIMEGLKRVEAMDVEKKRVEERLRAVELREKQIDDRFIELERGERGIDDRCKSMEVREKEVSKHFEKVRLKEKEMNEGLKVAGVGLEMKEKKMNERCEVVKLKEKEIDQRCKMLELKEKRFDERERRIMVKEKEVDEPCSVVELIEKQMKEPPKALELEEKRIHERWKLLELQEALELKEKRASERYRRLEVKEKEFDECGEVMEPVLKEQQMHEGYKELELKEKQMNDNCRELELKEENSNEPCGSVKVKEKEVSGCCLALQSKDKKMNEQPKAIKLFVRRKVLKLEKKQTNDSGQVLGLKGGQISEHCQGLALKEKEVDKHCQAVEQIDERCTGMELKEKRVDESCQAVELKEKEHSTYCKAQDLEAKEINERRKCLELKEKEINGRCQAPGPREKQINEICQAQELKEKQTNGQCNGNDGQEKEMNEKQIHMPCVTQDLKGIQVNEHLKTRELVEKQKGDEALGFELRQINEQGDVAEELKEKQISDFCNAVEVKENVGEMALESDGQCKLLKQKELRDAYDSVARTKVYIDMVVENNGIESCNFRFGKEENGETLQLLLNERVNEHESMREEVTTEMVDQYRVAQELRKRLGLLRRSDVGSSSAQVSRKQPQSNTFEVTCTGASDIHGEICSVCRNMDANSVRSYLIEHVKEHDILQKTIFDALECASDPAKLVLDVCRRFHGTDLEKVHPDENKTSCIFLLEQLMKLSPDITPDVKDEARSVAAVWRASLKGGSTPIDTLGFFQFLVAYKLASSYDADELLSLFRTFYDAKEVYRPEQNVRLCSALGLAKKIPGLIKSLIEGGRRLLAVKFICAFMLQYCFPPVPLLETHLELAKEKAKERLKTRTPRARVEAANILRVAFKDVLKCVSDFKLESDFPRDTLLARIDQLAKEREAKRAAASGNSDNEKADGNDSTYAPFDAQPESHALKKRKLSLTVSSAPPEHPQSILD